MKLHVMSLAKAGAVTAALMMLVLSIFAQLGLYVDAANQMMQWHMFYDLSLFGTITGMIEAGVITFVTLYLFGSLYNMKVK